MVHPNSAHPNSAHPNSAQPKCAHPNSAHPNSAHPNSALHFDDMDLNGDGVIDRAEFAQMQAHTPTSQTANPELQKVARWQRELESKLAEGSQSEPQHHGIQVGELQHRLAYVEQQLRANDNPDHGDVGQTYLNGNPEHGAAGGTNLSDMSPNQMLKMLQATRLEVCAHNLQPTCHAQIGVRSKLTIGQSLPSTCLLRCSRHVSKLISRSDNT